MNIFTRNKGTGQQGFTLIELLVVITILGVLVMVTVPTYVRFFGAGNTEADAAELSNLQAAMDGMMASYRITSVDASGAGAWTRTFDEWPKIAGKQEGLYDGDYALTNADEAQFEYLFPVFLRMGNADDTRLALSETKCSYSWTSTGLVKQYWDDVEETCVAP